MKVKFDLTEDSRLKAYYLLRLQEKFVPNCEEDAFDVFLNKFAAKQFEIGLDVEIAKLEKNFS